MWSLKSSFSANKTYMIKALPFWLMLVRMFHSMLISWWKLLDEYNGRTCLMVIMTMLVLMSMMVTFSLWLWFGLVFWNYLRDWMLVSSWVSGNFLKVKKCLICEFTNQLLSPPFFWQCGHHFLRVAQIHLNSLRTQLLSLKKTRLKYLVRYQHKHFTKAFLPFLENWLLENHSCCLP